MSFKHLPFGRVDQFNVVVEVPIGSRNKYEWSEEVDVIMLDYVFSEGFHWPFNYGYIPQTLGGDGDPLDAFVLTAYPLEIGTVVAARAIGMIEVLDRGETDNKMLTVPTADKTHARYQTIDDLPQSTIKEFKTFFKNLAREKEKILKIVAWHGQERAMQELRDHQLSKETRAGN